MICERGIFIMSRIQVNVYMHGINPIQWGNGLIIMQREQNRAVALITSLRVGFHGERFKDEVMFKGFIHIMFSHVRLLLPSLFDSPLEIISPSNQRKHTMKLTDVKFRNIWVSSLLEHKLS